MQGLSILGGDPLEDCNKGAVATICSSAKALYPDKDIWLWTGRKYEDVKNEPALAFVDVIVDGPFIERKKVSGKGNWFGSSNQRIIPLRNGGGCESTATGA